MTRYLALWRDQPQFARAYLVELPMVGELAIAHREDQFQRFQGLFEALGNWAREDDPSLPPLNPSASYLLVGGITAIVARETRAGRLDQLDSLHDELIELVTKTLR
jgi:hypothetical protein